MILYYLKTLDYGMCTLFHRLISVEDVRNYLSHIIYILIFDSFLIFYYLSDSRFQHQDVGRRYNGIREANEI